MDESPAQRQKRQSDESHRALSWLDSMWTQPRACPICAASTWSVGNVVEMREFNQGNIIVGGGTAVVPVVPVACGKCGYTFLLNAIKAHAIEVDGEAQQ